MLFNSFEFAAFASVVFAVYLVLPHRARNLLLLAASYVFYAAWNPKLLSLIAFSTLVDYGVGRALSRTDDATHRRRWLLLSLCTNLGLLGVFKYFGFFAENFAQLTQACFGWTPSWTTTQIVLPVGISFYTFQTLSYTIDIYRRRLDPEPNLLRFALFVAFFPQLVAGPIERASSLLPQIRTPRRVTYRNLAVGGWRILWGLFKKVVVADNLAHLVDAVFAPDATPLAGEVLVATWAFAIQIYCDFSGYTDMARGLASLMGFDLMLNFNHPYLASNPADFWRRWHISLSTWLRDYLYIPLGGNRLGPLLTYRNLLLTMLLGGLWHGAAWTFVLWGAYQGTLLMAHRRLREHLGPPRPSRLRHLLSILGTFLLVLIGWLIFRADSIQHLSNLLAALLRCDGWGAVPRWWLPLLVFTGPLSLFNLWLARRDDPEAPLQLPLPLRVLLYTTLVLAIALLGEDHAEPFIYFQF